MTRRPLRGGDGRSPLRWALVAVLAVAGVVSVVLGLSLDTGNQPVSDDPATVAGPPAPATGPAAASASASAPVATQPGLPASPPVSLAIPSIGVTTGLDSLGLNTDNTVQVPTDFARAGWYTGAPTPGQTGPAVVLGHIDSVRGPAVFYRLDELRPSDTVEVTRADGARVPFVVEAVREYPKDDFPTQEVYGAVDYPGLRLITCGGPFDRSARSYQNNIVVYARMQAPGPTATQEPGGPAALAGLTGPPTLFGRVLQVTDPATAVVEIQRRRVTVSVIGLGSTPICAQEQSLAFARSMLDGRTVTLVPDPTLPLDSNGPTWPAYLVLDTQQSYTDAAIRAGWARAGDGRYAPGFREQQRQAQGDGVGMWGPLCS